MQLADQDEFLKKLDSLKETAFLCGGVITEELALSITHLRLDSLPERWEDLALLPALEEITLPQQSLLGEGELPEGDYAIELIGGAEG